MAVDDEIKVKARLEKTIFYKPETDFGILSLSVLEVEKGNPEDTIVAMGQVPEPKPGGHYCLTATETYNEKYGKQYKIINMYTNIVLDKNDASGKRAFMENLFTENQIEAMYEALDDPYEVFLNNKVDELVKVKGIGFKKAAVLMKRFEREVVNSRIYVELIDYNLTASTIKLLLGHYKSPDLVIQKVKENPYILIDVKGIGWKKCDAIALSKGMGKYSKERVGAFIKYYLTQEAERGYTYVYANSQLMNAILDQIGQDISDEAIVNAIHGIQDSLWWSDDQECIGLKSYIELEKNIAKELIRIRNGENNFKYDGWEKIVAKREAEQGWSYTEQQKAAILATLKNNVVVISGLAGTGKSTVVAAILDVLKEYSSVQCALAGKAAARMAEITGQEGYTIHRLLGYPSGDPQNYGFVFHKENPLNYNIIIVDEISMINGRLFHNLISAIRTGAKLILLGDVGQLESIGCSNVAHDLIQSSEIVSIELTEIHRQAAKSAIITDSISIRKGIQPIEKDWVGVETRGVLMDLTYECYSDASNTFYRIMQQMSELLHQDIPINDIQVIVPIKERDAGTWNLNLAIQELYNPLRKGQHELIVSYDQNHVSSLRVGDKVINVQNNYNTCLYAGQWERGYDDDISEEIVPVFNGNIGTIEAINERKRELIVNFDGIGRILIKKDSLKGIMLGYAITVHKSQGSQAKYIIFGCDFSGYSLLSRELIYTAITRAQKHCYIKAQNKALRLAVSKESVSTKQTILQQALYNEAHPKLSF